ncbi:MAG: NAD(P)-binding protein, partial [Victivallales bacterium]|nr:NAD(P)-binding protein [Victivallales bacterium]
MHYDALIIGAGLSGLGAGIRLAIGGRKVRIFESHSLPGGLNSYYVRGKSYQDVGLHAITNYAPESQRGATLNKILRQLRIKREELHLCQQRQSDIAFPSATLKLNNDFQCFREQIKAVFPSQLESFDRMVKALPDFASVTDKEDSISARAMLGQEISDPLLREMLLCPVMFYGNPTPDDMSYGQFAIMFRSIVMEGMSRPLGGMKSVVQLLVSHFASLGGELSLCNGIRQINCKDGCVQSVTASN